MEIQPFELIHYPFYKNLLERVVCPPYDKFSNPQITDFRNRDEHNFVWAILGETLEDHGYHYSAAETLRGWLEEGILEKEPEKNFLVYRQRYTSPLNGQVLTRSGFYGLLKLPEREEKAVLPHERTFSEHKADRLKLYHAVRGTPEGIFVLFSDPEYEVAPLLREAEPAVVFEDFNGHQNELCLVNSLETIAAIREVVEAQKLLIADGHHRFETGQDYRDACRAANPDATGAQSYDYILVYFAALEDPGLVILPTHRPVRGVSAGDLETFLDHARDFFEIEEVEGEVRAEAIGKAALQINDAYPDRETVGLVSREKIRFFHLRDREKLKTLLPPALAPSLRDLPVVWLHQVLMEKFLSISQEDGAPDRVAYVRTGEEVYSSLQSGYDIAFLLRGTRPEEVKRAAESGERMPQKSTDFYPKVLSGLAVYLHP